jgi:hypothetical protein
MEVLARVDHSCLWRLHLSAKISVLLCQRIRHFHLEVMNCTTRKHEGAKSNWCNMCNYVYSDTCASNVQVRPCVYYIWRRLTAHWRRDFTYYHVCGFWWIWRYQCCTYIFMSFTLLSLFSCLVWRVWIGLVRLRIVSNGSIFFNKVR